MGSIYRQKNSKKWWIKYYVNGRPHRESSQSEKETEARRLLRLREGDIERGVPLTPRVGRIRFEEAAADVINDYRTNGKRSLDDVERRIEKHLKPVFGRRRMATITTADVRSYVAARQAMTLVFKPLKQGDPPRMRPVSNGEINRELTVLKRMFSLAIQAGKLLYKPYIPMLQEDNVRTGFFELEQFQAVRNRLPEAVQGVATFAVITGWRMDSEILPLQWRQIDFVGCTIRLDRGTTKNKEGRVFPLTDDLRTVLEHQKSLRDELARTKGLLCPWVFHRDGKRIKSFRRAWLTACKSAGCPGRIFHDFRRTAVRGLVRAGIPERVAMQMTGHKTRSVFERYNIVSEGDLRDAARRLNASRKARSTRSR
jgi:integrase